MCHYSTSSDSSPSPDRLSTLIGVSAAWHEVQRVRDFLESKGLHEASGEIALDYQEWRRELFAAKEAP